jgi:sporulation protein YlmC with PRC-barrel domain
MGIRRIVKQCILGAGLAGLLYGPLLAGEQSTQPKQGQSMQRKQEAWSQGAGTERTMMLQRTNKIIGREVKDNEGQRLGTIYDLVLTPDCEQVSYAALHYGGMLGRGGKLFAVSLSALRPGTGDTYFLSVTKEDLENATGFRRNQWPAEADPRWSPAAATTMTPAPSQRATEERMGGSRRGESRQMAVESRNTECRRVTRLTGAEIKNTEASDIGDVEGFVIDTDSGQVVYTVVSLGGFLRMGEKYALVPENVVEFQPRHHRATVNATKKELESIAFAPSRFPDLANMEYAKHIFETFGEQPYWVTLGYISPAQQQGANEKAWASGTDYNKQFNPGSIKTVSGTIESVGTFEPQMGVSEGLRLRVMTADGNVITVHVGPEWYVQQQGFSFKSGDKVTVTGSETQVRDRSVIMATKLECDGKTLELRSDRGEPKWKMPTP